MAKAPKAAVVEKPAEAPAEEKAVVARGPKDVALEAKITLVVKENPKRPGSKAHERFAYYTDGMTVKEALDAGITTPDLIYDTAHNFVNIEGYDPKVKFIPKVKEPKAPKEPKAKTKKAKREEAEEGVEDEDTVE